MKLVLTLLAASIVGPAFAHATFEQTELAQNSTAKFTTRIGHGCDGEPTLRVRIQIPEGVIAVKPMPKAGWTLETVSGPYRRKLRALGRDRDRRRDGDRLVGRAVRRHYDEFVFRGRITDHLPVGETLYIPVVQECANGAERWIEIPAVGQDADELEFPAPGVKIVPAAGGTLMPGGALLRVLAAALLLALAAGGARAHAQLQASDPAADAVLEAAPAELTLTFSEPVAPLVLRWIAPGGAETEVAARTAGQMLAVTPPPKLEPGTHLLSWRVVSTDGHPIGGTFAFSIGAPSSAPPTAAEVAAGTARFAAAARFALSLALVLGVGGAVCLALVRPAPAAARAVQPIVRGASLGVLPLAALAMGAQGLDMMALGPAALAEPRPWVAAWGAPICDTALLAAAAALVSLRGSRAASLVAWGLGAVSFAVSGHAPVAPAALALRAAVALHGLALVFWMGALLPLAAVLRAPSPEAALRRFSAFAVPLVAVLQRAARRSPGYNRAASPHSSPPTTASCWGSSSCWWRR